MQPTLWRGLALGLVLLACPLVVFGSEPEQADRVDFNRQIRPILSNTCFKCHGPDAAERQAGLRLDLHEQAVVPTDSGAIAIVPGEPEESELVARIFSDDESLRMPPPDSNKSLSQEQKELLRRWIEQGAPWQEHWSFVPPKRPPLPAVTDAGWPRSAIDYFILARLEQEGLRPSPPADKVTLIRRATLDLTGLPPTPAEVDAFLGDDRPGAYDRVIDRLLMSPHFGERLAVEWLDAARYADTHGYHIDSGRDMWLWRNWVIDAFNRNLPFDQFTIQQLAGDLLPGGTLDSRIASGFNRNHMINFEGGAIPEEYHAAYIVDRVNTTSTVWLGLTIACSQCHDHKYDPITQREYFQLYAFFHNVPENGLDGSKGNAVPLIKVPSVGQQQALDQLAASIGEIEHQLAAPMAAADAAQVQWEQGLSTSQLDWTTIEPLQMSSEGQATLTRLDDRSILVEGANPGRDTYTFLLPALGPQITAIRVEAIPDDSLAAQGPGRSTNGNFVLTEVRLAAGPAEDPGARQAVPWKKATADFSQREYPIERAIDGDAGTGWAIFPQVGKPHAAVFELEQPLADSPANVELTLEFQSPFGQHQLGRLRLSATSAPQPHGVEALPDGVAAALATGPDQRNAQQQAELRSYYRTKVSTEFTEPIARLDQFRKELAELEKRVPTTMVMQELPEPRETFLLVRGQYDKRGEKVLPGVPASLPPLPSAAPHNRLGLAQWLVDPSNPLTARVIVNRYWQMLFGSGLVTTPEDFGVQGQPPTHPQLLDWLATEFVQSGWDVKHLLRLMVTSATYRQSALVTPELLARDPDNRLLARGPRFRLKAEFIRDQALAASGLLERRIGGPSVSPYQPEGLWQELASREDGDNWTAQVYVQNHGADLYRRGMYTFWKRTSPPPTLVTFDAPDRETCTVRRARTNTPLQALVLLNDPTYVEAARKLAERTMLEASADAGDRAAHAFRLLTARLPTPDESQVLVDLFQQQLQLFAADNQAAIDLLAIGESPRNDQLDPGQLAAWTVVASAILNLDETVTRP